MARFRSIENPFVSTDNTDVVIKVDGETLHLHSGILSVYSPVFKELFNCSNHKFEVDIKNERAVDVIEFFRFFYPEHNSMFHAHIERMELKADKQKKKKQRAPLHIYEVLYATEKERKIKQKETEREKEEEKKFELMIIGDIQQKQNILALSQKYQTTWVKEYMDEKLLKELHVAQDQFGSWTPDAKMSLVHLSDQFELAESLNFFLRKIAEEHISLILNYKSFHELKQDTVNKIILNRLAKLSCSEDCYSARAAIGEILGSYCQYHNFSNYNLGYKEHGKAQNKVHSQRDRFTETKDTDVLIKVGEKNLHLHSAILCHYSPVFRKMLEGNFKEARTKEIELNSKQAITVSEMFRLCYANRKDTVKDNTNFVELIPLCHEYQVTWLLKEMEERLVQKPRILASAVGLLLAERYNLSRYKETLISLIHDYGYTSFRRSDLKCFHSISKSLRYQLAKHTLLTNVNHDHQSEINTIFQALDDNLQKENVLYSSF